jgi:hypothetical protein
MSTKAEEFRIAAAECLTQARRVNEPRIKHSLVTMAQMLTEAAMQKASSNPLPPPAAPPAQSGS